MSMLTFQVDRVRQLVQHAQGAPSFRALYGDPDTAKPGLWLVADQGIYLMSPGLPMLADPDKPDSNLVAYAHESDPTCSEDWYESKRALVGGDDFGDWLPLDMFAELPTTGLVTLSVTASQIERLVDENGGA